MRTGTPFAVRYRLRHRDGSWRWFDGYGGALAGDDEQTRFFAVQVDVREQVQVEERLRESQRLLETLISNLPGIAYRVQLAPSGRIDYVSDGYRHLTGYDPAQFIDTNAESLVERVVHPDDRESVYARYEAAFDQHLPYAFTYRIVTASGETKWLWDQGQAVYDADGMVQAVEGFATDVTESIRARDLLKQRVAERTRELETLLELSRVVVSTLEPEPLFETILDQIGRVIDNNAASIGLIDGDVLTMVASRRDETSAGSQSAVGLRFVYDPTDWVWQEVEAGRPLYSPNVRGDDPVARAFRARVGDVLDSVYAHVCSWMAAPLVTRDRLIGAFFVSSVEEDHYGPHDMDLAMATANQIAVAIENARLHEQARSLAAIEERQRLARELHDSVSQALYGIGLGARTARTLLDQDPGRAVEPLDYVLSLAEAALAEMRALIFELRPESLQVEGLVAALRKQADAVQARHRITVRLELPDEPDIPLAAKEALYRIAQEAMHNTTKHARAATIDVRLAFRDGRVELAIADDGRGFDAEGTFPGHLGLTSMRERAVRLGGVCTIESALGHGTRVRVVLPVVDRQAPESGERA
jgi:PAS domain S-box-containing protein